MVELGAFGDRWEMVQAGRGSRPVVFVGLLEHVVFAEAEVPAGAAYDDVVENLNVEDVGDLKHVGCYLFVGVAWFWVAGWVVVCEDEGVGVGEQGSFEYFAGVDERGVEGSFAYQFHADDLILGVEVEGMKFFGGAFVQADDGAEFDNGG